MNRVPLAAVAIAVVACLNPSLRADEDAIREFFQSYLSAFNDHDAEAVSAMWTETGVHLDRDTGERTVGRAGLKTSLAGTFSAEAKPSLTGKITHVQSIKDDVASVSGTTTISVPGEDPAESQFTAIVIKSGDLWQIASVEESAIPQPATARDALQKLGWMEGTWVDDSGDQPIISSVSWSQSGMFLLRAFVTQTPEGEQIPLGTQVIGWDPRSEQIRSWTFHADGAFGDGVWSNHGDEWLIKSTETMADGRAASGTYVLTIYDDDSIAMQLIGHEVEGEPVPATDPVAIVRVPSEPTKVSGADTSESGITIKPAGTNGGQQ